MNKVIGYARISTEEQSNFSISNQTEAIEQYCHKNNYELVDIFVDEGQSAKNFDRVNWKKLQEFLSKHHKDISYLILYKYDRFSRNLPEALDVINNLEQKQKIRVMSICEPIALPPESPFFFQFRTQILLQAHMERDINRDRTIQGIRKAKREGRFLGKAPVGYVNAKDSSGKPIIVLDPIKAEVVKYIFHLATLGYKQNEIKYQAKTKGLEIKQHDGIARIIGNVVYKGFVFYKNNDDEIEYFPGIHEPIVDEQTFQRANKRLSIKQTNRQLTNDTAYMKGALFCDKCFSHLSCGNSKGRKKYYWYYVCGNCKHNHSVEKANLLFDEIIKSLKLNFKITTNVIKLVDEMMKSHFRSSTLVRSMSTKIYALKRKIESLEEKHVEDDIDKETYLKWKLKYDNELKQYQEKLVLYRNTNEKLAEIKAKILGKLSNLHALFHEASSLQKLALIKNWLGDQLTYDGERFRTNFINPLLDVKSLNNNALIITNTLYLDSSRGNTVLRCPQEDVYRTQSELRKLCNLIININVA